MAEPSLELLQAMVQRVLDTQALHSNEFQGTKQRLAALKQQGAMALRTTSLDAETVVTVQAQVDRLGQRPDRIGRRLDLVE